MELPRLSSHGHAIFFSQDRSTTQQHPLDCQELVKNCSPNLLRTPPPPQTTKSTWLAGSPNPLMRSSWP